MFLERRIVIDVKGVSGHSDLTDENYAQQRSVRSDATRVFIDGAATAQEGNDESDAAKDHHNNEYYAHMSLSELFDGVTLQIQVYRDAQYDEADQGANQIEDEQYEFDCTRAETHFRELVFSRNTRKSTEHRLNTN